jgi:hypothetical protein
LFSASEPWRPTPEDARSEPWRPTPEDARKIEQLKQRFQEDGKIIPEASC